MSVEAAGLTLITATAVPGLMGTFLPPLHEVRDVPSGRVEEIRRAEAHGALLALGMGAGASVLAKSPWPFLVSLGMVGYLLYLYERPLTAGKGTG